MSRRRILVAGVLAMLTSACGRDEVTGPPPPIGSPVFSHTTIPGGTPTNVHIVVFDVVDVVPLNFSTTVTTLGGTVKRILAAAGLAIVANLTDTAADLLEALPGVESVTRDVQLFWLPGVRTASLRSAPAGSFTPGAVAWWDKQWGLQRIQADRAWALGVTGQNERVVILDTGIDYGHQELAGKVNLSLSRSYVNEAVPAGDHPVMDLHFHGTHVAGIVAAQAYRIAGVSPGATLIGYKVLNRSGQGTFESLISGVFDAGSIPADVANLSLGALLPRSNTEVQALTKAVRRAVSFAESRGVLVVAAAGNSARNLDDRTVVATPCEQATLCVSATGPKLQQNFDQPAWYTNTGDLVVDVAGPGGNYDPNSNTTWQAEDLVIGPCSRRTTNPSLASCTTAGVWYIYLAGTSMAAPHASGVGALVDSKYNRSLNGFAIRDRMYGGADDLGAVGKDDFYGFGRINAYKTSLR